MCELMFPKQKWKKKRKKHKKSILHEKDGTCYLCAKLRGNYRKHPVVHKHHIYPGVLRQVSEREGFTVYLCPEHHNMSPESVHQNHELMELIQKDCQRRYEETHTRQQFRELTYSRNYLKDEDSSSMPKGIDSIWP